MTGESYESGNRRAEIDGQRISFFKISGNVRRSKQGVWFTTEADIRKARRLAKRWVFKKKLGKPVMH